MNYEENHEEQSSRAEEPATVAYSVSPHVYQQRSFAKNEKERLRTFLRENFSGDFLQELEAHNFYTDQPIPFDTIPQTPEEWDAMTAEAEASGWLTDTEFKKDVAAWKRAKSYSL